MEKIGEIRVTGWEGVRRVEPIYRVNERFDDIEQRNKVLKEAEMYMAKQGEVLELYNARGHLIYKVS
jgi:hypothetical protein